MSKNVVGEARPSQLLWSSGPGALIDLPNLSVITMGIDRWDMNQCRPIEENRLLNAVRRALGRQVNRLLMPPIIRDENVSSWLPEGKIGVPVRPFPRWLRCVECGLMADIDLNLFKIKTYQYRPDKTRFVHSGCIGSKSDKAPHDAQAVPVRFLLACRNGHLDDFPWHWYVHKGHSTCKGTLRFFEAGASLQTENLWVKCDQCGESRSMVYAFGSAAGKNLPSCRGRHPHLNSFDKDQCEEDPRAVLLGATNSWFPVYISVLAIPLEKDQLMQLVSDGWEYFSDAESSAEVKIIIKTLIKSASLPGIEMFGHEDVWKCIQERNDENVDNSQVTEGDLKRPEWEVLTSPKPPSDWPQFISTNEKVPRAFETKLSHVLLLERLREVNALIGYTRVEAPEEDTDPQERPPMASISRNKPEWVPAVEVHGEGIFLRFNEESIKTWEQLPAVKKRSELLNAGYRGWRAARKMDPISGFPGVRYAMLHTLAHLLIRELSLECGYNAASIRERIYASSEPGEEMAGIIIYTAAADSDGTLGGLVELGKQESLDRLLKKALDRARICSSDPLCSEHEPSEDRSLHSAACHSCSFVAETSCERGNRFLDRALLVETVECSDAAFFER
jgi:hypothetical protein